MIACCVDFIDCKRSRLVMKSRESVDTPLVLHCNCYIIISGLAVGLETGGNLSCSRFTQYPILDYGIQLYHLIIDCALYSARESDSFKENSLEFSKSVKKFFDLKTKITVIMLT